jgi:hypothetical protein
MMPVRSVVGQRGALGRTGGAGGELDIHRIVERDRGLDAPQPGEGPGIGVQGDLPPGTASGDGIISKGVPRRGGFIAAACLEHDDFAQRRHTGSMQHAGCRLSEFRCEFGEDLQVVGVLESR